jgi:antitoxin Phd
MLMPTMTAVRAQSRFGELLDLAQREPVAVTRHGRTVAYVVSEYEYQAVQEAIQERANAVRWYDDYVAALKNDRSPTTPRITSEEINQLINEH